MQSPNNGLGRYGEEVAARRLAHEGLHILERNWRCAEGELDIVALDGDTLAICEVKTRSENAFQQPTEGIDRSKADRLRRLAERWLAERWPTYFELLAERVTCLSGSTGIPVPAAAASIRSADGPAPQPHWSETAPRESTSGEGTSGGSQGEEGPRKRTSKQAASGKGPARKRAAAKGGAPPSSDTRGGAPHPADPPTPPPPGGVRIDLVAVINRAKGAARVEHVRGAV
ncbi:Holliday junction resolvase-like predicted endonuclease [Streptomyces sp. TLI_235]|nr:Holliday junction resolvase-like predicted endonuclease [Streptomyces sp. TLI_235]